MANGTDSERTSGAALALTGHILITLAEDDGTPLGRDRRTVWARAVPRSGESVHDGVGVRQVSRVVHLMYPVLPNALAPEAVSPVVLLRPKG